MKRFIIVVLLFILPVCVSGCQSDSDNAVSNTQNSISSQSESFGSDTDNTQAELNSTIKNFLRPAFAFSIEKDTPEPVVDNVVFLYDEKGRIKQCDYLSSNGMKCKALYTYNDTYAHIFTFGETHMVDDLIIHCEYNDGADWTIINGYYFKNILSTESSDK